MAIEEKVEQQSKSKNEQVILLHGDCLTHLRTLESDSIDALVTDPPAGIGFMNREWDSDKGGRDLWIAWMREVMEECLRVLKPGAHGLVWALPRTSHWTATALEDAGFEIRDIVMHLFGTGFPKSLNIAKAIDGKDGRLGYISPNAGQYGGDGGGLGTRPGNIHRTEAFDVTLESAEARQWDGWGTTLKPSAEHWILVRKPISEKNVAANVVKHATGGLNLGGCKIESKVDDKKRVPSHTILSHDLRCVEDEYCVYGCAVALLDFQKNGAWRSFYCAKPSRSERGLANDHPTVKSLSLMRYLIRLICAPGGVVLDPFVGSGTTMLAARAEGMHGIGIDTEKAYIEMTMNRLDADVVRLHR